MEPEHTQPFVSLKRRKSGSLFLTINTRGWMDGLVKRIISGFVALDQITQHRAVFIAVAGIGLGLGLSLTVFQQPATINADTELVHINQANRVEARELRLPTHKVATRIIWDERSAGLGETGAVLVEVKATHPISADVQKLSLGENIQVIGSNNGIYSFTVVETRELPASELNTVVQQNTETVVVYTPSTVLSTNVFIVIARPTN
jgi:hypothetical protein